MGMSTNAGNWRFWYTGPQRVFRLILEVRYVCCCLRLCCPSHFVGYVRRWYSRLIRELRVSLTAPSSLQRLRRWPDDTKP